MKRVKIILSNVILHRILVIFAVGLVSRSVVNSMFDINVFKEYTDFISLGYYGLMACFSTYVNSLPSINLSVFNLTLVRDSIRSLCESLFSYNKVPMGMSINNVDKSSGLDKDNSIYCARRPSAAIVGLYGREGVEVGTDYVTKHSTGNKLRCKLLWHSLIKYTENYGTYKDYLNTFNPRYKVSIVDEFKRNRDINRNK